MNGAELIILGGPLAFGVAGLIWARHATRIRRAQKQNTNHASGDESHSDCTLCGMSDGLCVRCGRDPEEGEDMSEELKPCPFCGAEAWLDDYEAKFGDMTVQSLCPQCKFCGCNLGDFPTKAKAIAAWNRRYQPPEDAR